MYVLNTGLKIFVSKSIIELSVTSASILLITITKCSLSLALVYYVLYAVSCYVRACTNKPKSAGYLCGQGGFVEHRSNILPCGNWKATLPTISQEGRSAHNVSFIAVGT